ncbi:MAG: hypothetical protein CL878_01445 [Dehalococcoidia bacterium]|nr:hypothetical protein [Dehalococcoidia bacterium]
MGRRGRQWLLPKDLPPWPTVYHHPRKLRNEGTWEEVMHTRPKQGQQHRRRDPESSAASIDDQSFDTTEEAGRRASIVASRRPAGSAVCALRCATSWPTASTPRGPTPRRSRPP